MESGRSKLDAFVREHLMMSDTGPTEAQVKAFVRETKKGGGVDAAWQCDLISGWWQMRSDEQYKNTGRRYQKAIRLLTAAHTAMMEAPSVPKCYLAYVHLWLGMCYNECHDFDGTEANEMALAHYALAKSAALDAACDDTRNMRILASALNSMGVAQHHLAISLRNEHTHLPVPAKSLALYNQALRLLRGFSAEAEAGTDNFVRRLREIIYSNMGKTEKTGQKQKQEGGSIGGLGAVLAGGGNLW